MPCPACDSYKYNCVEYGIPEIACYCETCKHLWMENLFEDDDGGKFLEGLDLDSLVEGPYERTH